MNRYLVVIPKGLGEGIIRSQIFDKFLFSDKHAVFFDQRIGDLIEYGGNGFHAKGAKLSDVRKVIAEVDYIYVRSVLDFIKYWLLMKIFARDTRMVYDVRGLVAEESYLKKQNRFRYNVLNFLQMFSLRFADRIETVSNNLASILSEKYGVSVDEVSPCCVPKSKLARKMISDTNKESFNFIYVGSMAKWQCFEGACEIFKNIEGNHNFYVVTRDTDKAKAILKKYGVIAEVVSGNWELVESYLDRSDFGFIYRENNIINRTASPVKFVEYVSRGVIPVMSAFVGDYSKEFREYSILVDSTCTKIKLNDLKSKYNQSTLDSIFRIVAEKYVW